MIKAILDHVRTNEQIVVIEQPVELKVSHPNAVRWEAVEQYVEREERREQFRQDALAAWDHHQATGLHVTAAEAEKWLARLVAGKDAPPRHATTEMLASRLVGCHPPL